MALPLSLLFLPLPISELVCRVQRVIMAHQIYFIPNSICSILLNSKVKRQYIYYIVLCLLEQYFQLQPNCCVAIFGAKALNGSLGPRTRVPNDRTQMLGPKYRDPNSQDWNVRVPSAGTHRPRTQMKGPRCWDPSVF